MCPTRVRACRSRVRVRYVSENEYVRPGEVSVLPRPGYKQSNIDEVKGGDTSMYIMHKTYWLKFLEQVGSHGNRSCSFGGLPSFSPTKK